VPGLFVTGFAATRDFGPFFGFVRGCPVAAALTTAGLEEAAPKKVITRRLGRGNTQRYLTLWATGLTSKPYPLAPDVNIERRIDAL